MRSMVLFLLALGIGALTVVGQGDERADLLTKIKELEELLEKDAAARRNAPQDKFVIRRFYDVSNLTTKVRDQVIEPSNLRVSQYSAPEPRELAEPAAPFEIDSLMDLIRNVVEPETWDSIEGADIAPKNSSLIVTNIPRVQRGIKVMLDRLGKIARRHVVVDVIALPVNKETAALLRQRPRELSPAEAKALGAMKALGTLRVTCFNGQQSVQRSGARHSYLQDYDVEIAQASTIGDPIRAEVFSGFSAEIQATMDLSAKGVLLQCRLERTRLDEKIRKLDTEHGPLDLPVLEVTRVSTSLWAPFDRMVVVGGTTGGTKPCVFVATARLVE